MLSSCHAMGHHPEQQTLTRLAGAMRAGLARYKRSELAACLDAFQAWEHDPGRDLLQVRVAFLPHGLEWRTMRSYSKGIVSWSCCACNKQAWCGATSWPLNAPPLMLRDCDLMHTCRPLQSVLACTTSCPTL